MRNWLPGAVSAENGLDVKLARGGIRDIEFLVQCLQRLHGGREPWVRHGGTLLALTRLNDKNLHLCGGVLAPRGRISVPAPSRTPVAVCGRPSDATSFQRTARISAFSRGGCPKASWAEGLPPISCFTS